MLELTLGSEGAVVVGSGLTMGLGFVGSEGSVLKKKSRPNDFSDGFDGYG